MKKRGLIVIGIGIALMLISLSIAMTIIPDSDPTLGSELFVPNLLEGMFDQVTEQREIYPDGSVTFSYTNENTGVPLMWGLQIIDYNEGDNTRIKISNIFGDDFGIVTNNEPVLFDMFVIEEADTYNFEIENLGQRPINVVMMFIEDPENSEALNNPDSPLVSLVLPLAISGIVLIVGIFIIIIGIIILIMDWKKEKNHSRYY